MDQQEKPAKFLYLPQAKNDHFIIGGADDRPAGEDGRDQRRVTV